MNSRNLIREKKKIKKNMTSSEILILIQNHDKENLFLFHFRREY
jgi:hypothetical protein